MVVVAASQNKHKLVEIEAITQKFGMKILSRDEYGIPPFEVKEDGITFEENSYKKAHAIWEICKEITIADDSGIEVDALDGAPGVYSARYAGDFCDDNANNRKLLKELEGIPEEKRTGRYVAVITMIFPDGNTVVARGECEGHIMFAESGENGFGYDPLFRPLGYTLSFGEISAEEKNKISHRSKALVVLQEKLASLGFAI